MAVAMLWTVTVGGDIAQHRPDSYDEQLSPNQVAKKQHPVQKTVRQISCFLQGLINIIADFLNGKAISLTGLFPQQYPRRYAVTVNTS